MTDITRHSKADHVRVLRSGIGGGEVWYLFRRYVSSLHLAEVRGIMHVRDAGHCDSKAPDPY